MANTFSFKRLYRGKYVVHSGGERIGEAVQFKDQERNTWWEIELDATDAQGTPKHRQIVGNPV